MGDDSLENPREVGRPPCQDVVIKGDDIDLGRLLPMQHCWGLGADPATILGAVTPVPDTLSEYRFAGLLRGGRTELAASEGESAHGVKLKEKGGYLLALEGPFGDHTGYYNEQGWFPVFKLPRVTHRRDPVYRSTYTDKPPDEPAALGVALNEVFVPILQKQFPEIVDFYLPPEGFS